MNPYTPEDAESFHSYHDHREETNILSSLPEAPGDTRIEKLRSIVAAKSIMLVEGQPVDLFSANLTVQVYDLLGEANKPKLMKGSVLRTINIAFRTVERARGSR